MIAVCLCFVVLMPAVGLTSDGRLCGNLRSQNEEDRIRLKFINPNDIPELKAFQSPSLKASQKIDAADLILAHLKLFRNRGSKSP